MKKSIAFVQIFLLFFTYFGKAQLNCTLDPTEYQYSMNVTSVLIIDGTEAASTAYQLGAYVQTQSGPECRGLTNLRKTNERYFAYLTVYSNQASGESIVFKMWDGTSEIDAITILDFEINAIIGSISNPYEVVNNYPPTDIELSSSTVAENQPAGTVVGTLSTTDPNEGDTHTYSIIQDYEDFNCFSIDGNQLKTAKEFDFETKSTYTVKIETNDIKGGAYQEIFSITIVDNNDIPSDIQISSASIAENSAVGTDVGTLLASDQDPSDVHEFSLNDTENYPGNNAFMIDACVLKLNTNINFETKPIYTVNIQTEDQGGATFYKTFQINVLNANDAPVDLFFSETISNTITMAENSEMNTIVGTLETEDEDINDTHKYTFANGSGTNNNDLFVIDENHIRLNTPLDYETKGFYYLYLQTEDSEGATYQRQLIIEVTDANDPPTGISLSDNNIDEELPVGSEVCSLISTDIDKDNTFTYSLVSGVGDTDNDKFAVSDGNLISNMVFDFETENKFSIRLRTTDQSGAFYEEAFQILINDKNDAPIDFSLSVTSVNENMPVGTLVGELSTIDWDTDDSHLYSFVDGENDNDKFTLSDNRIVTAATFDYEVKSSYSVQIQTTDMGGKNLEKEITIHIIDTNDKPIAISLSNSEINENLPEGSLVGSFETQDADANDEHSYTIAGGNENFYITGSELRSNMVFDFETKKIYSIEIQTDDKSGAYITETFSIEIQDTNDPPDNLSLSNNTVPENVESGTIIGTLSTSDIDENDTHTYSLADGSGDVDNANFQINANQLITKAEFDFERKNEYHILVMTEDQTGGQFKKQITIYIVDGNDAPQISNQEFRIDENAEAGAFVGKVRATDTDNGQMLSYVITGGNEEKMFIINQANGEITVNSAMLDFEEKPVYELTVEVTDNGVDFLSASATITIQLNNRNETPEIKAQRFSVSENAAKDDIVGTVIADDTDADFSLMYELKILNYEQYEGDFPFEINESTGEISVRNTNLLDYEAKQYFTFDVAVTDEGGLTAIAPVTVMINDAVEQTINATNFITPNGDGHNDYWELKNPELYSNFKVMIFNNAGEMLFETENYQNDWDGSYDGEQLPQGTYFYIIKSPEGEFLYRGTISLVR